MIKDTHLAEIVGCRYHFFPSVGVSPSGKAAVFGIAIRRFESFHPKIQLFI